MDLREITFDFFLHLKFMAFLGKKMCCSLASVHNAIMSRGSFADLDEHLGRYTKYIGIWKHALMRSGNLVLLLFYYYTLSLTNRLEVPEILANVSSFLKRFVNKFE